MLIQTNFCFLRLLSPFTRTDRNCHVWPRFNLVTRVGLQFIFQHQMVVSKLIVLVWHQTFFQSQKTSSMASILCQKWSTIFCQQLKNYLIIHINIQRGLKTIIYKTNHCLYISVESFQIHSKCPCWSVGTVLFAFCQKKKSKVNSLDHTILFKIYQNVIQMINK